MMGPREEQRLSIGRSKLKLKTRTRVFANISQRHEDYGMSPGEHAFSKANRTKDSRATEAKRGAY